MVDSLGRQPVMRVLRPAAVLLALASAGGCGAQEPPIASFVGVSDSARVDEEGAGLSIAGRVIVAIPAGAVSEPMNASLSVTYSEETVAVYDESVVAVTRFPWEVRIETGRTVPREDVTLRLHFEQADTVSMEAGQLAVYAQLLQDGAMEILDNFHALPAASFEWSDGELIVTLSPRYFRRPGDLSQAIVVVGRRQRWRRSTGRSASQTDRRTARA